MMHRDLKPENLLLDAQVRRTGGVTVVITLKLHHHVCPGCAACSAVSRIPAEGSTSLAVIAWLALPLCGAYQHRVSPQPLSDCAPDDLLLNSEFYAAACNVLVVVRAGSAEADRLWQCQGAVFAAYSAPQRQPQVR